MSLRPSNLPKLAVCPCYESSPVAGPAAARGTLLDEAFLAPGEDGKAALRVALADLESINTGQAVSLK